MILAQTRNQKRDSTVFKEWVANLTRYKAQPSINHENLFIVIVIIKLVTAKRPSLKEQLLLLAKCLVASRFAIKTGRP